jgi:hypothetical protein
MIEGLNQVPDLLDYRKVIWREDGCRFDILRRRNASLRRTFRDLPLSQSGRTGEKSAGSSFAGRELMVRRDAKVGDTSCLGSRMSRFGGCATLCVSATLSSTALHMIEQN